MVVFYKYVYTELLLCRSSWGSVLQFRTPCFLGPLIILDWLGSWITSVVRLEWWKRTHTHIHSPCSCHRPSSSCNDFSLSRMLPVEVRNTGLW